MQGRGRGYKGHEIAENLISKSYSDAGLIPFGDSYFQDFRAGKYKEIKGRNILGVLENPGTTQYIVVSSYYDSIGLLNGQYYAGADANASGVAAMLEVISHLRASKLDCGALGFSIIFASFDCHVDGQLGSISFWQDIAEGKLIKQDGKPLVKDDIALMIDLDQLGNSLSPGESRRNDYLFAIGKNSLSGGWVKLLDECNEDFGLEINREYMDSKLISNIMYKMGERRDFITRGIPVICFTAGFTDHNNRTTDTPQYIDFPILARRTAFLTDYIASLSGAESDARLGLSMR